MSFPGLLNDLVEHALERCAFEADRSGFDGKGLRTEGFHLETVPFELVRYLSEYHHLPRFEFHQQGHEQSLALNVFNFAFSEDLLEKHTFVCDMLIDDPEAVFSGGEDKGFA